MELEDPPGFQARMLATALSRGYILCRMHTPPKETEPLEAPRKRGGSSASLLHNTNSQSRVMQLQCRGTPRYMLQTLAIRLARNGHTHSGSGCSEKAAKSRREPSDLPMKPSSLKILQTTSRPAPMQDQPGTSVPTSAKHP